MALDIAKIPISFVGGADTKSDPKQVRPPKLLAAENVTYQHPGEVSQRYGNVPLARDISGGATRISAGQALMAFQNELTECDGQNLYSYNSALSQWTNKGQCVSGSVVTEWVNSDTYQQTLQDGVTHSSGLQCYAWEDSSGGSRYNIIDSTTGQTIVPSAIISLAAVKPKAIVAGNIFALYWFDKTTTLLMFAAIPVGAPLTALTPVALTTFGTSDAAQINATHPLFDVTFMPTSSAGANIFLAFRNGAAGITIRRYQSNAPATTASQAIIAVSWDDTHETCLAIFGDDFYQGPVVAYGYSKPLTAPFKAYNGNLGTQIGSGNVGTGALAITGVSLSSSTLSLAFFVSTSSGINTVNATGDYTVSAAGWVLGVPFSGLVISATTTIPTLSLAAKAFAYNGRAYATGLFASATQPTYFTFDQAGNIVAKWAAQVGGAARTRATLGTVAPAETSTLSTTAFRFPLLQKEPLLAVSAGTIYAQTGVIACTLDLFDGMTSFLRASLGRNLHMSGGFLQAYDGVSVTEDGFHLYPDLLTLTGGGGGSTFSYVYLATYEWTDAQGQIHRSGISPPLTVKTNNAIDAGHTVTITIPDMCITAKQGGRTPVNVVVCRTINNGSATGTAGIAYRVYTALGDVNSPTNPLVNDPTGTTTLSFVDGTPDTTLTGNPECYTSGGVQSNAAPDPLTSLTVYQNRLVGLASGLVAWYSKQVVPPAPAEFSLAFTLNIDPRGGDATAVATLVDKLIFFKETSILYMTGQGPDAAGTPTSNDFSDFTIVTTDVGCVNPRSIVTMPGGLMFQSAKGIYLLGADMSVQYIGADVEAFNGQTILASVLVPTVNQVRFYLGNNVALVFDYYVGQWSVYTNTRAVDAALFGGTVCYLRSGGAVMQESTAVFSDAGRFVPMKITTPWIQVASGGAPGAATTAGFQGFQRAYRALLLGEWKGPHRLVVSVAYDFKADKIYTADITPDGADTYGTDVYGVETPYGGTFPLYQPRIDFGIQTCEALQITLETQQSGAPGEAASWSGLTIEAGVKRGAFKRPASATFGTT